MKGCLGMIIGIPVLIFLALFGWTIAEVYQRNDANRPDTKVAPIDVGTAELATAYRDNESAAKSRFGENPIRVTGVVESVSLNATEQTIVSLNDNVSAHMLESAEQGARALHPGDMTSMLCNDPYYLLGIVSITHCVWSRSPALDEALKPKPAVHHRHHSHRH